MRPRARPSQRSRRQPERPRVTALEDRSSIADFLLGAALGAAAVARDALTYADQFAPPPSSFPA